ncbi:tyrosine-type recombinase/integrase [Micromonospora sp. NPDC000316]|uniref:tyrosine-type recombinase/integrase n=1 Tax=Micromonospora sp. NPDC000316 TaxID=3364216 RepID=UPI0036B2AFB9
MPDEEIAARGTQDGAVPAQTLALFRAHRRQHAADRLVVGERWQDPGLVFPSKFGTPMDPDHIDRTWHKIRAAAGLDWLRLHDLRHACATFLLVSDASPRRVMKVFGHSQIGLTMNTYAHVMPRSSAPPWMRLRVRRFL